MRAWIIYLLGYSIDIRTNSGLFELCYVNHTFVKTFTRLFLHSIIFKLMKSLMLSGNSLPQSSIILVLPTLFLYHASRQRYFRLRTFLGSWWRNFEAEGEQ